MAMAAIRACGSPKVSMAARGSDWRDRDNRAFASEFRDDVRNKRLHATNEGEI
jgi:hypothetical protein